MKLPYAVKLAGRIVDALAPLCERVEIAGSIRRLRQEVGDIDLVVQPKAVAGQRAAILNLFLNRGATIGREGEQYVEIDLATGEQIDLWFAHGAGIPAGAHPDMFAPPPKPEPSNFGILLLSRTGSAMHNVYLAQHARSQGLHFAPHRGILRGKEVIASAEEPEIFAALGLPFIPPERRER